MACGVGTVYLSRLDECFGLRFQRISHEEGRSVWQPKCCRCGSGDGGNDLNDVNSYSEINLELVDIYLLLLAQYLYYFFFQINLL